MPTTQTKKENRPRQQHWVPRVYLKHFATAETFGTGDPKVFVWDKSTKRIRGGQTRVGTICSQQFLYTPKFKDGSRDWSMEEDLGDTESRAGTVWPVLMSADSVLSDPEIRTFLAHFVALMHLRNVRLYDTTHKAVTLIRQLYGAPKSDPSGGLHDVEDLENFAKGAFVRSIRSSVERVSSRLLQKRWAIMRFRERIVATGDRPILFFQNGRLVSGPFQKETRVLFPLSPDRVLYMDDFIDAPSKNWLDGPPGTAALINSNLQTNAQRIVIGARPLDELPTLDRLRAKGAPSSG